jgi:hypothetical protein
MSYRSNYRSIFSGLGQTSKTATTSTSSTSKSGSSAQPDRTAQDWATALQTGGSLVSSIIGAATGQQQPQTPASTEPTIDPNAALAPAPATPSWYWPVVIGVGGALLAGIVFVGYTAKKPVKANRRRMRRNGSRGASVAHLNSQGHIVPGAWIRPQVGSSRFATREQAERLAKHINHAGAFDVKVVKEPSNSRPNGFSYQVYIRSTGVIEGLRKAKKPVKPSESQKIDGCSAWLTALAVALRKPPKKPSVYETRGVRVL